MRKWKDLKNKKKIKRSFYDVVNLFKTIKYKLQHIWYWIRTHTYNRYHIIDVRNSDYSWGWIDADYKMFFACCKCLEYFVEQEECFKYNSYEGDWKMVGDEIKELYTWWKFDRQKEIDEHAKNIGNQDWDCDAMNKKDDMMLDRLMKIRRSLWT